MSRPRPLVVTTVWNTRPEWLMEAVASVEAQDAECDHVLADDGSQDADTLAALDAAESRVHEVIRFPQHRGPGQGLMNDIIARYDHGIIAPLDSDDVLLPGSIGVRLAYLQEHPEVALVSHAGRYIDEAGNELGDGEVNRSGGPYYATTPPPFDRAHGGWVPSMPYPPYHSACMYRRKWLDRVGGYPARPAKRIGDWGLYAALLGAGAKFTCLPDVLILQRVSQESISFAYHPKRHALLGIPWMSSDPQMGAKGRTWMREQGRIHKRIVEVGVYEGNGLGPLAAHGATVWGVDRWTDPQGNPRDEMYRRVQARFRRAIEVGRVHLLRMDSADAAEQLYREHGNTFDLVFIDGDHRYSACQRDIDNYTGLVRPGGMLAGHDYSRGFPGVRRAVKETFGKRIKRGPASIWMVDL